MPQTEKALHIALAAMAAVRERLVVVGGTAQRLFLEHPLAGQPPFELLTTEDVDLAAPAELAFQGSLENLLELLKERGFEERILGWPHAAHRYPLEGSSTYLQFLSPQRGSGTKRDGTEEREMRFGGLVAEILPRVEILLHQPWSVTLVGDEESLEARVVNPIAYVVQKILVLPKRQTAKKKAKDILYLHDTLAVFARSLDELGCQAHQLVPNLSANARRDLKKQAETILFVENEAVRNAAELAVLSRGDATTPASVAASLRRGLPRLLSGLSLFPAGR
jgi:hypothetical protein